MINHSSIRRAGGKQFPKLSDLRYTNKPDDDVQLISDTTCKIHRRCKNSEDCRQNKAELMKCANELKDKFNIIDTKEYVVKLMIIIINKSTNLLYLPGCQEYQEKVYVYYRFIFSFLLSLVEAKKTLTSLHSMQ